MQVYYQIVSNGDGSYGLEFFDSQAAIDLMCNEDPEYYPSESCGVLEVGANEEVKTFEKVQQYVKLDQEARWDFEWN